MKSFSQKLQIGLIPHSAWTRWAMQVRMNL